MRDCMTISVVVRVRGEVDIATAHELGDHLSRLPGSASIEVDLTETTFLDCSGIRVLLLALHRAVREGGDVTATGATGIVARVFELTGLAELFAIQSKSET